MDSVGAFLIYEHEVHVSQSEVEWFNVCSTVTLVLRQLHDCLSKKPFC